MILVVGATGLLGREVCRRLAERGERVRALVRPTSSPEKIVDLTACGIEAATGDLKDPESLRAACRGVDTVVSTASSTLSRQAGDSIESVDGAGQLHLVEAAKAARIDRFVFVSFRSDPQVPFPLSAAKREVERALAAMNHTIIQAGYLMEVWLSPALGFDYANGRVRIYGAGTNPLSWVAFRDVAEVCAVSAVHPAAQRATIEFGGPEALSPLQVTRVFEAVSGRSFEVEHLPEEALWAQYRNATDAMQKSFAGLMLHYSRGDAIERSPLLDGLGRRLTTVEEYARRVTGSAAQA
jgi:uncharacterized protein YbjT (DUF2867 family)